MKRIVSVLLALCLMLGLCGCGGGGEVIPEEQEPSLPMPFGLTFGMNYDEFAAKLSEKGLTANPLKPAANQYGYKPDVMPLPTDDPSVWEFTGSELLKNLSSNEYHLTMDEEESTLFMHQIIYRGSTPCLYASFNQKKELFEVGFLGLITNEKLETPTQNFIKALAADITPYYDSFFGTSGKQNDCTSSWENGKYSVRFYQPTTGCYALIITDYTYDTDTAPLQEEGVSETPSRSTTAKNSPTGNTTTEATDSNQAIKPSGSNIANPDTSKMTAGKTTGKTTAGKTTAGKTTNKTTVAGNNDPCAYGHDWVAVYETVHYEEKGHYETVITGYNTNTTYKCAMCYEVFSSLSDYYTHFAQHEASSGQSASIFKERYETLTEQEPIYSKQWVVDQEEETVEELVGYECRVCNKKKN